MCFLRRGYGADRVVRPCAPCHCEERSDAAIRSQRGAAALMGRRGRRPLQNDRGTGQDAVPYTRFNIPSCRAGPVCPAAGYAFFGGTHGSRPTEKTDSRKNNAAPLAGRRAFRPCIAQTEEGYIRRFYKREPRGIPPKGRKGANLPGNDIPRVFYFPIIYFQRKYASTAFPTVTSRQSKGTRRTCAF